MKKLIVLIMLLFSFFSSMSQVRLQYTVQEIKDDFKGVCKVTEGYLDDGTPYLTVWTERSNAIHLFTDNSAVANKCLVIPLSKADLNYLVEQYNKKYVILSDTHWKMYSENGVSDITLMFDEELGAAFLWE